jgi:hemerythrin superfamily protein
MPNRMDSMIAKGTGTAKAVEARVRGLVGVFKTLAEEHGEASALLKRVKNNPAKRADLWPKIRQELVSHEKGEMREVYPVLRANPETSALAEHHDTEAGQLSALIDRIHATDMASDEWGQLLDQLISLVEHHVHEEEHDIFPKAQEAIGADRARELEPRFLATKKQIAGTV